MQKIQDYLFLKKMKRINRRKYKSYSASSDVSATKYYVIRRLDPNVGIFSCILTFLTHLCYAEEKGYIPVIDMMNFDNEYLYPEEVGKKNAWEFYFEQPAGISVQEAYCGKHVLLSHGHFQEGFIPSDEFLNSKFNADQNRWKRLWDKYIKINEKTLLFLEEKYMQMISRTEKEKILGVLCRGTDYFHYTNAQNVNNVEEKMDILISKIYQTMQEKNCEYVFLATEDADILERFTKKFDKKLLFIEDDRISSSEDKLLGIVWKEKGVDLKQKGLNYILNFYILSKLDYFIGARTSATVFLPIVGTKKYSFFYDLVNIEKEIAEEKAIE